MSILEDLLAAVQELTATLQSVAAAAPTAPADTTEKPTRARRSKGKAAPATTIEEVRAALKVLIDAGRNDDVKALLKEHGGNKLGDIAADQYEALKAAAEAAAEEEGEDDLL